MMPAPDKPVQLVARHRSLLGVLFGMSAQRQAIFFRQLASMIDSGMTSSRALDVLGAQTPGSFGIVLRELAQVTGDGHSLSAALALYPEFFSEFVVCMVHAGEVGGMLDERMRDLAAYLEQAYTMRAALVTMMVYPVIVLHAAILLPPLVVLFQKGWMAYLLTIAWFFAALYGGAVAWWLAVRFTALAAPLGLLMDRLSLVLPGVGGMVWRGASLKFARALGELLEAGLPVASSLQVAGRACGNRALAARISAVVPQVQGGMPLSQALPATGVFSPVALQMLLTAEVSGTTASALRKISDFVTVEYNESVKRMAVVLPILLLFAVGGMVAYQYIKTFMGLMTDLQGVMP